MNPGWLTSAMESAFSEAAPACQMCGDEREVLLVAVGGDEQGVLVPCLLCPHLRLVPWRTDVPAGGR